MAGHLPNQIPGLGLLANPPPPVTLPANDDSKAKSAHDVTNDTQNHATDSGKAGSTEVADPDVKMHGIDRETSPNPSSLVRPTSQLVGSESGAEIDASRPPGNTSNINVPNVIDTLSAALEISTEPAQPANGEAEWEVDSSRDSDDTSSDSSRDDSSSDDEADGSYPLLSAEETARLLMREDFGEDEGGNKGSGGKGPRTASEISPKIEMPQIELTPEHQIVELGTINTIVDNVVLIKANTSGEYQVLDEGSMICLPNRVVVGLIYETLGRVQAPHYSIIYNSREQIDSLNIREGSTVCFVVQHSKAIFTHPLRNVKGSDASNINDEEVAANEMEFSDDEAEAAHKRAVKLAKGATRNRKHQGNNTVGFLGQSTAEGPPGGGDESGPPVYTQPLSYD